MKTPNLTLVAVYSTFNDFIGNYHFQIIPSIGDRVLLSDGVYRVDDREIPAWLEDYGTSANDMTLKIWVVEERR